MFDLRFVLIGLLLCPLAVTNAQEAVSPEHAAKMKKGLDLFRKSVRPILTGRCLNCHGGESVESELDLRTRASLLRGGAEGQVLVSGKPMESRLYRLAAHLDEPFMPEDGAKLSNIALKQLAEWIELGAPYDKPLQVTTDEDPLAWTKRKIDDSRRDFWSLLPLSDAPPPAIDDAWVQTPIDRFILAALRQQGLQPNEPADKHRLIRRAYFDLIGLPPSADEIEQFVSDSDPRAYERLIDRLLDSQHYGERWGRHWLDVARFAESHGFEQDYDRPHAYHYRDFVIRALNDDLPYDQFVRWQLAGDEFSPENPLAMMATGFLGAGVFPTQLTEKEFESARYDALDDMVATTGTAFLGLTVGCARCHDHKFDPIPASDYYRMLSSFTTAVRSNIQLDLQPEATAKAIAAWEQDHEPLAAELRQFEKEQLPARFEKWLASAPAQPVEPAAWSVLDLTEYRSKGGATLTDQADGSLLATGTNPDFDAYTLVAQTHLQGITSVRLEALKHKSMAKGGPGRAGNGNIGLGTFTLTVEPLAGEAEPTTVTLTNPRATFQQNASNLALAGSLDGNPKTGWAVDPQFGKDHAAVFDLAKPIGFDGGSKLMFTLDFTVNNKHNIGRPRLSISTDAAPVPIDGKQQPQQLREVFALLAGGVEKLNDSQRSALQSWHRTQDEDWRKLNTVVADHLAKKPQAALTEVMVVSEGLKPIPHHADGRGFKHFYPQTEFLKRGDVNQKQGVAEPGFLQVLMRSEDGNPADPNRWQKPPPDGWRTSYRRRALAEWLTDSEHGAGELLARVIVNRVWQHHLGTGIVSTPNDFGFQGQRPTHPELLDWLARELIAGGWKLKALHKRIMLSAVYRQSAEYDEAAAKVDPQNQWLWRRTPRRLEAEIIRDSMLAASGRLDRKMFGPGTLDAGMKRRSIYFMIKRSKLIPMMQVFDAPEPLVGVGNRPSTTIAPQALMFMNNAQVRGSAAGLAARLREAREASEPQAIRLGYLLALARDASAEEIAEAAEFVRQQTVSYQEEQHDNAAELALTDFAQVLLSLNEFVYID